MRDRRDVASHLLRGHLVDAAEIEAFAPSFDELLAAHERTHRSQDHLPGVTELDKFRHAHDGSLPAERRRPDAGALRPFEPAGGPEAEPDLEAGA